MSDVVLLEKRNKIAYVTINRPEKRNSINHAVRKGLAEAWVECRDDKDVWTIILTGTGEQSFCAGGDLKENLQRARGEVRIPEMARTECSCSQVMVRGSAPGGLALSASCGRVMRFRCSLRVCRSRSRTSPTSSSRT